jgi:hypothetical protein
MRTTPFPYRAAWIRASPFKTKDRVAIAEEKYKKGVPIGFTALASLRSMGRVPRTNGYYIVGDKYKNL